MRFERGQNINEAIGIGIFSRRKFEDDFEATTFIWQHLLTILDIDDIDELPDHMLRGDHYFEKIVRYTVDYVDVRLGGFRTYTYEYPDDSLIYLIIGKIQSEKILRKTLQMAEEKGYHVIRKG